MNPIKHTVRSWHVAIMGIIGQAIFGAILLQETFGESPSLGGILAGFLGLSIMAMGVFAIVPTILLFPKRTRKAGAFLCLIVGILLVLSKVGIFVGFFLSLAGILHLKYKL